MEILAPDEIARIEREYAAGLPVASILEIFRPKGIRLSEATFRKYVQAGLLPRSRRVGRKGKHKGSQGLYPVEAVRRINVIKKMMSEGFTLEDIKHSFIFFKNHVDQLERGLDEVLKEFESGLTDRGFAREHKRQLELELVGLRERAQGLIRDVSRLGSAVLMVRGSDDEYVGNRTGARASV